MSRSFFKVITGLIKIMRSEKEMMDLILNTATADERIRAVVQNGSRVNPDVKKDIFQDYDIVYFVRDIDPFKNKEYIKRFGKILVMQTPDDMVGEDSRQDGYAYLMQFTDGNRIDLTFNTPDMISEVLSDSLSVILLDKDGLLGNINPPDESGYFPSKPSSKQFNDCCNEFWWVNPYVAKALWRKQTPYARHILEHYLRKELSKMKMWYFGIKTGFCMSPGKSGSNMDKYMEPEIKYHIDASYPRLDDCEIWDALYAMGKAFRIMAVFVAEKSGFEYNKTEDENVTTFIHHIHNLPQGAKEIF